MSYARGTAHPEGVTSESFQNGDFSAKHILKRTKLDSRRESLVEEPEEDTEAQTVTCDVTTANPITISGGFRSNHDSMNRYDFASTGSPQQTARRQSMLSSIISTTPIPPKSRTESVASKSVDVVKAVGRHLDSGTDSLKQQGGDMTRGIYNWYAEHGSPSSVPGTPLRRSTSVDQLSIAESESAAPMSAADIKVPGGFRRSFLLNKMGNDVESNLDDTRVYNRRLRDHRPKPNKFTRNFIEFLAVYGNFAGENLNETEDESESESSETETEDDSSDYEVAVATEDEPLMGSSSERRPRFSMPRGYGSFGSTKQRTSNLRKKKITHAAHTQRSSHKKASNTKATLLLLKAFIGTGVVFLPKSFSNGGLVFCNLMLLVFSFISYYCFVILVGCTTSTGVKGYGELGEKLFGPTVKFSILCSLALSQLGFSSAYTVFVAENLKSLANSIFHRDADDSFSIEFFILLQLIVFIPLSLTRQISKLGATALIADVFILAGLIYIVYCSFYHLVDFGVSPKIAMFKSETWSLFMGTAVFAFEGIGLLIPVKESMERPQDFDKILFFVMVVVTLVFTSISTISYLSYGDDVKTVILLNFADGAATKTVQLLYATAILLSTPLQLFPAIKIIENYFFSQDRNTWQKKIRRESEASSFSGIHPTTSPQKIYLPPGSSLINQEGILSGKSDTTIKWTKNLVRLVVVLVMCLISYTGSNDLDKFVSLIGSFTCVPLIYIYPPLLYMKASNLSRTTWWFSFVIACIGSVLMVYTSYQTIASWLSS